MTDIIVSAKKLCGSIKPPPFKSEAIRYILLAALSGVCPTSVIQSTDILGDDIRYAIESASAMLSYDSNSSNIIAVGDSATLLRLMLPIMLAKYGKAVFKVGASLYSRDIDTFHHSIGCNIAHCGNGLIKVQGRLEPKCYSVDVAQSSQFASGMLLALPLVPGMELRCEQHPVSEPYLVLTISVMQEFGVYVNRKGNCFSTSTVGYHYPGAVNISSDSSYAANFVCANYFGSSVDIQSELIGVPQADSVIYDIIANKTISVRNCPDLFPILCVAACGRNGTTRIIDIERLRGKESDRVRAMHECITAIGGNIRIHDSSVEINGYGRLAGGEVDSFNDHRIVMAMSIASLISDAPVLIHNADAISKSAPQFFTDFMSLGGSIDEYVR